MTNWQGNATGQEATFGSLSCSALMSRVRSTGNKTTELRLARLLDSANLEGRESQPNPFGSPNFAVGLNMENK